MWKGLELESSPWKPYPQNRCQELQMKRRTYPQKRRRGEGLHPPGLAQTYGGFQPLPGANIQPRAIQKTAGEVSENPGQREPQRAEGPPQDEKTQVPPPQISTLRCPAGQVFTPKIKAIRSASARPRHRQRRPSSLHEGNSPPHSAQESGIGSLEELSLGAELELLGYPGLGPSGVKLGWLSKTEEWAKRQDDLNQMRLPILTASEEGVPTPPQSVKTRVVNFISGMQDPDEETQEDPRARAMGEDEGRDQEAELPEMHPQGTGR